jgi:muramoyltetrapeptide carboxypeptidase
MAIIPPKLNKGERIGVVSPSTPVTQAQMGQLQRGVAFLENLGFEIVLGQHVYATSWSYAAAPQEKGDDLNRMFADETIKAIVCSQGGDTANACLPYLDWEVIRANPKIFLGISDITVLLNAIHHQTGLVTFHGNDVLWGFGRQPTEYDRQEFIARLIDGEIGAISSSRERSTIRPGAAAGKLLGGNLRCLLKLAGTPYFPDFTGAILFVEAMGISPEGCDTMFQQLKQMDIFDQIRGAVVGYIDGLQNDMRDSVQMEEVLLRVTAEFEFPILKVNDFGHNCPNSVLPVGGEVRIDASRQTYEILEPCVQR